MKYWILGLLAGWMSAAQAGFSDSDLLPVDEAFALEASFATTDRIVAKWTVADGYYLYRSKFRFSTDAEGIRFGEASYPAGKIKQDEFFGEIETYRHQVAIEIPVIRDPGAPDSFELKATSQGCADIGVCYPPNTQLASLTLAAAEPAEGGALQSLSDLGIGGGFGAEEELLPAEQAFQPDVEVVDGNTLAASWKIAEGYYLYRHKFEFILEPVEGVTLQPAQIPEGEHKTDEFFGEIQVFHDAANAVIPLQRSGSAATPVSLTLKYQGCAEIGVCYPPMSRTFELLLPAAATAAPTAATSTQAPPSLSEQDAIAKRLTEGSQLTTLLAFFGFGLLLAFTPCVFPMIPILSSIIVGQGPHITVRKSFVLSLVYVLAMAATYTVAGVIAGKFGHNLQAAFQNPWVLSSFAGVFVLLSLSMFGFYDLQMPASIQGRLSEISNRQSGGNLVGVAIMGFLSALDQAQYIRGPFLFVESPK